MPAWCLPKHIVDAFLEALKSGKINPEKMMDMTSQERREFLSGIIGQDNAERANALFESKMLLKDQQRGMVTWAKNVAGITPKTRKDLISRINRMDKILTPETEDAFLSDLAAQKLGVTVTSEEAANIASLAKTAAEKKAEMEVGLRRKSIWDATDTEMAYGRASEAFREYVGELKGEAKRLTREEIKNNPMSALIKIAKGTGAVWKSIKATLDNSALGRQGWKVLANNPKRWLRLARQSMVDIYGTFTGQEVMAELNAAILSHPDYDSMVKDRLAITTIEEEFPGGDILNKIPAFGILHKAAENSFKGFIYRTRVESYLTLAELARKAGITDITGRGYGMYANSLGSRGNIGRLEALGDTINITFFSLRKLKSDLDFLTAHALHRFKPGKEQLDWIAQKEALKNVVKVISVTAAALTLAGVLGADIERDPRSSDFGKARVGNTTFDFTGGMGSMVILAARFAAGSLKTASGEVIPTRGADANYIRSSDLAWNYFENKLSPPAQFVKNLLNWQTWEHEPLTFKETAVDMTLPLSVEAIQEAWGDPKAANLLLIMLAEQAGIAANTYQKKKKKKPVFGRN